jgi:cation diffusion facilitator CzcD-associated flavoprotein CzcO
LFTAIIVGAGFSGLCAGIQLRRFGIGSFLIVDKADRIGGTWRDNSYPGAACDIPSHLYAYSFEPSPRWKRTYGGQAEILAYLEHCVDKYDLRKHLRLGTRVVEAVFDRPSGTWTVTTDDGHAYRAQALILGNGALHRPSIPDLPGAAEFAGTSFHSARWDHSHDLRGRRVAVIGTGASAIQIVPQIAPEVAELHVYQRTPPWVMPKLDRTLGRRERWLLDHVPGAQWLRRTRQYWLQEARAVGFVVTPRFNQLVQVLSRRHRDRQISDPALRAKLEPSYVLGCKRVLVSNDYYPALQRDNVELITDPIAAIEPAGIRTQREELRAVDTIIYATGFLVADYLAELRIVGTGRALADEWTPSIHSYLGITVAGFPNMFLLMGPNTGLGHNSMIFMIEAQVRYAVAAIRAMRERGAKAIEVRPAAAAAFRAEMARRMPGTVWASGCSSWYLGHDGKALMWPGFTVEYWRRTRKLRLEDYELS